MKLIEVDQNVTWKFSSCVRINSYNLYCKDRTVNVGYANNRCVVLIVRDGGE